MTWIRAQWSRLVAGLALAAVAAVAGIISYDHIESLTLALHQPLIVARLMPFGVDGLIVVGSVVLLTATPGAEWLGWLGVGPGVAASVFANVESGLQYGWLAATWAGVPAGSFCLACFLLERWLKAQASIPAAVAESGSGDAVSASPDSASEPLAEPPASQSGHDPAAVAEGGSDDAPDGTDATPDEVIPEPPASHPEPPASHPEPDPEEAADDGADNGADGDEETPEPEPEPEPACPHTAPTTAEEAVVAHYLHARDCLGEPVSQRQLATAFAMSRTKVADLVKPLNGHQLDGATTQ